MRRKKRPTEDFRPGIAATRLRMARERLGIPELEKEAERMQRSNAQSRICGEGDVFDSEDISELLSRIRMLEKEAADKAAFEKP